MWELLSDPNKFGRFLQYVALIPLVLRFTELVETRDEAARKGQKLPEKEKREKVAHAAVSTIKELVKRGYIPASAVEGLEKTAGELRDVTVIIYRAAGFLKPLEEEVQPKEE